MQPRPRSGDYARVRAFLDGPQAADLLRLGRAAITACVCDAKDLDPTLLDIDRAAQRLLAEGGGDR